MNLLYLAHRLTGPNGLSEWGIIELQGDLEASDNLGMDGEFIGDLSYDKAGQPVSKPYDSNRVFIHF